MAILSQYKQRLKREAPETLMAPKAKSFAAAGGKSATQNYAAAMDKFKRLGHWATTPAKKNAEMTKIRLGQIKGQRAAGMRPTGRLPADLTPDNLKNLKGVGMGKIPADRAEIFPQKAPRLLPKGKRMKPRKAAPFTEQLI